MEPMDFIMFYGLGLIGSALVVPVAAVGVLLELIYRHKPKTPLRVIAIILITLSALALILSVAAIIYLGVEFTAYKES